jgi:hypothetical protein
MPVVQITSETPVRYSLDNGIRLSEFNPGELYAVPDYAAKGMIERNWAKIATPEQIEKSAAPEPEPQPQPPKGGRKAKS